MSKASVLGCLVMVGVGLMGCGPAAQCPAGYARVGGLCMVVAARDAMASADAGFVTDAIAPADAMTVTDAHAVCVARDETCNALDDDCDGRVDEELAPITFYVDADEDGFGDAASEATACAVPEGAVTIAGDCDDASDARFPLAAETCDGVDTNCDAVVDTDLMSTFYADADHDGYGDATLGQRACAAPSGYVADARDCDDANAMVHPDASELCNDLDDDCDAVADDGLVFTPYYVDADGDGFAPASAIARSACRAIAGWTTRSPSGVSAIDCADEDGRAFPGQREFFSTPIVGHPGDYDFDCDDGVRMQYIGGGWCHGNVTACDGVLGFIGTMPSCGPTTHLYQVSCGLRWVSGVLTCAGTTEARLQACN